MNRQRAVFTVETVAHLRGLERELLPVADYIATLHNALAGAVEMLEHVRSGGSYSAMEYIERVVKYKEAVEGTEYAET